MKCHKVKFKTETDAMIALASGGNIKRRHEVRYYLCPKCNKYHLTSQPEYALDEKSEVTK